jgi:hypothetical protein
MKTINAPKLKEHPMLYSTPMVTAILDDRKDITRRMQGLDPVNALTRIVKHSGYHVNKKGQLVALFKDGDQAIECVCPYGGPGDLIWVRETIYAYGYWSLVDGKWKFNDSSMQYEGYRYMDNPPVEINEHRNDGIGWYKRPSIFMPREAIRLKLYIESIRVERLHDITPDDACREGINYWNIDWQALNGGEMVADYENYTWTSRLAEDSTYKDRHFPTFANPIDSFRSLWESINGKASWDSNPWVWRIEFNKYKGTPIEFAKWLIEVAERCKKG